ncbi:MAG: MerR family transcriptional regulator [Cyanobacteria bacterium P01_G01_bin.67]
MSNLMKIGELARKTGLSIRTLRYYDEIDLLSPSHRTEVGYRLYSDQDIIRLQQILSLRQLKFSLQEIGECLENPEFSLQKTIDLHRARVKEQIGLSHTLLQRLETITRELKTNQSVTIENLIEAMETITMSEQYFTSEQQEVLEARFREVESEWQELIMKTRLEMSRGADFNSPSVQEIARLWQWSMKSMIGGDEGIYQALIKMYQQEGTDATNWGAMDLETFEFIIKAVSFLSIAEDIEIVISDENYTADAIQVIRLGLDAVRNLNYNFFGTEGLLLGFLAENTGVASQILITAGVTFGAVEERIVQLLGSRTLGEIPLPEKIPFVPRVRRVIELARGQSQQLGQTRIDAGHLLLGILQEAEESGGGVASHILQSSFGIDLANLEQELWLAISQ